MTAFDRGIIDTVDARIEVSRERTIAIGTVQTRDTVGPGTTVVFDDTDIAMPVKTPGHVHILENDRVVLQLFETTWVVLGTFNRRQMGEANGVSFGPSAGASTTSGTFVDMPNSPSINFTKRYDLTAVRVGLVTGMYVSTAPTLVQTAIRIAGQSGTLTASTFTAYDTLTCHFSFNTALEHGILPGWQREVGMPAGDYTLTARWRRPSGSGTLTNDLNDRTQIEVDEIYRTTEV